MSARSLPAMLVLLAGLSSCADLEAASRIEMRRQNALAAIKAARDVYCALSPAARRQLLKASGFVPAPDDCVTMATKETAP